MKTIKFLQESFETKERFQQEISFKYSYNRDTVLNSEIELLQEKLDLIREEICELIGVNPNLKKQGHEDNYVFNLNIESDNQIGFFLQETEL